MFCLMWSISPYHPTFNDRVMPPGKYNPLLNSTCCVSVVLQFVACTWVSAQLTVFASPLAGMTMAPHLEGHDIHFNASERRSWKKYARSIDEHLKRESQEKVLILIVCRVMKVGGLSLISFGFRKACRVGKPLCDRPFTAFFSHPTFVRFA